MRYVWATPTREGLRKRCGTRSRQSCNCKSGLHLFELCRLKGESFHTQSLGGQMDQRPSWITSWVQRGYVRDVSTQRSQVEQYVDLLKGIFNFLKCDETKSSKNIDNLAMKQTTLKRRQSLSATPQNPRGEKKQRKTSRKSFTTRSVATLAQATA